jgi:hypothetical protein
VADQIAKGVRTALWQDNETGAWCAFTRDLDWFRNPTYDSIFTSGLLRRLRPRGGTTANPIWPSPTFEDVRVVISILPTDVLTKPAPPPQPPPPPAPPQPTPTKKRKQAALPRGRPADYDLDAIREATETFIREIWLPETCTLLMEKVEDVLDAKSIRCPGPTRLRKLVGPIYKRAKNKARRHKKH